MLLILLCWRDVTVVLSSASSAYFAAQRWEHLRDGVEQYGIFRAVYPIWDWTEPLVLTERTAYNTQIPDSVRTAHRHQAAYVHRHQTACVHRHRTGYMVKMVVSISRGPVWNPEAGRLGWGRTSAGSSFQTQSLKPSILHSRLRQICRVPVRPAFHLVSRFNFLHQTTLRHDHVLYINISSSSFLFSKLSKDLLEEICQVSR